MKSSLQWGLSLGAIALILMGVSVHHSLTQTPSRLTEVSANPAQRRSELQKGAFSTVRKIPKGLLTTADLNAFLAYRLALKMEKPNGPQVLLGTQVELTANSLKSVAVVDLSKVDESSLENTGRLSLARRLLRIPGIRNRQIAIAVEGKPMVRDCTLSLEKPMISVGEIQLTTSEAVHWLGLSQEILLERINREWSNLPIDLEAIDIIANNNCNVLKLTGSPTAW